jgi:hypothetical protein
MKTALSSVAWTICLAVSAMCSEQTWTGQISDSQCGAVHTVAMMEKHAKERGAKILGKTDAARECTLACVSDGGKYVFVSEGKIYEIENQGHAGLPEYAGQTVNLTGSVMSATSNALRITSLTATAKRNDKKEQP